MMILEDRRLSVRWNIIMNKADALIPQKFIHFTEEITADHATTDVDMMHTFVIFN